MDKVHGMFFSSLLDTSQSLLSDPLSLIRSVDVFSLDIEDVSYFFPSKGERRGKTIIYELLC